MINKSQIQQLKKEMVVLDNALEELTYGTCEWFGTVAKQRILQSEISRLAIDYAIQELDDSAFVPVE